MGRCFKHNLILDTVLTVLYSQRLSHWLASEEKTSKVPSTRWLMFLRKIVCEFFCCCFHHRVTALPEVLTCPFKYLEAYPMHAIINQRSVRLHFWKTIRGEREKKNIYIILFLQWCHDDHAPSNNSYGSLNEPI